MSGILVLCHLSIVLGQNIPIPETMTSPLVLANRELPSPFTLSSRSSKEVLQVADQGSTFSVIDIIIRGSRVWMGTSDGVYHSMDFGGTWVLYDNQSGIGRGGVSGLAASLSQVWAATSHETLDVSIMGSGLAYTLDDGNHWDWLPQPTDSIANDTLTYFGHRIPAFPVTSSISNVTYDIALTDSLVFLASWAGGLRKSVDMGISWQRVVLPGDQMTRLDSTNATELDRLDPRDPSVGGHHNHKGFSVLAYEKDNESIVWCGTAHGINKSTDGGLTWTHYSAQTSGISGNWVVALHRQTKTSGDVIWASTMSAMIDPGEENGISYTSDNGTTWRTALIGKRSYNISSFGDTVLVSTRSGLYRSVDGQTWEWFQKTAAMELYNAVKDTSGRIWIGTSTGFSTYQDDPDLWHIIDFENAPSIISVSAPDTMIQPPPGEFTIDTVWVTVSDPDGEADVVQVWFTSLKPDSQYANQGQPIYLQKGTSGLFFTPFILPSDAQHGTYTWTFLAEDASGNMSEPAIHYVTVLSSQVSVTESIPVVSSTFTLHINYPNPFNSVTTLRYDLPQAGYVLLIVYDIQGREVTRLVDSYMGPGYHQNQWDGRGTNGQELPSGIYIARLVTPEYTKSIKMVLLK